MKKTIYKIILIILILVVFSLDFIIVNYDNHKITNWNLTFKGTNNKITVPYYLYYEDGNINTCLFTSNFKRGDYELLVLPRISGNAYTIYLNNKFVGSFGDMNNPTTMLKNFTTYVELPQEYLKENNTITIKMNSYYKFGFKSIPHLGRFNNSINTISYQNFIMYYLNIFSLGVLISLIILITFFKKFIKDSNNVFIHLLLYSIGLFGYIFQNSFKLSTYSYNWMKVFNLIPITCKLIPIYFFIKFVFIKKDTRNYLNRIYSVFLILLLTVFIISPTLIFINYLNNIANILFILYSSHLIYIIFRNNISKEFGFSIISLSLIFIHDVLIYLNIFEGSYFSNIAAILLGFEIYYQLARKSKEYKFKSEKYNEKSKIDPLTGAYNRNKLSEINFDSSTYVCFIDIDNFKTLNDTYGHEFGDKVLEEFVKVCKIHLRSTDTIVRYGGDEFLLILNNINLNDCNTILKRIDNQFNIDNHHIEISFGFSQYIDSLEFTLNEADKMMYIMKNKHDK